MVAELQIQNREASVGSCRGDAEKMTKLFLSSPKALESPRSFTRLVSCRALKQFISVQATNGSGLLDRRRYSSQMPASSWLEALINLSVSFWGGSARQTLATRTWSGSDDIESKAPSSTEGEHLYWIKKIGKLGKIKRKSSGRSRSKSISINRPTSPEIQRPFPTIPIKPRLNRKLYFFRQT